MVRRLPAGSFKKLKIDNGTKSDKLKKCHPDRSGGTC